MIDPDEGVSLTMKPNIVPLNEKIVVVYTSKFPNGIPEREKVSNAPSIRAPYSPRQIAALISHMKQQPSLSPDHHYGAGS